MPAQNPKTNQEAVSTLKNETERVQVVRPEPLKKNLLEWEAPVRPFKKRSREFFSTVLTIAALIIIILAFLKEWFLILTVVAFVFLVFVVGKIPSENVSHKITNRGIITGGKEYRWGQLGRFWFEEKYGQKILYVENFGFPRVLMMLLGQTEEEKIKNILSDYLPQETPEKTWMDRAAHWLTTKISLEDTK
ncbi:MAG: hypothetical protein ACPLXP_00245 [Microgenomates group bacterium]